jgi:molybdopterin molybdotransferase
MPEFLTLLPPAEALKILLDPLKPLDSSEYLPTAQALGRVTMKPVIAPHSLPSFSRSTVDGFAVRATDTYGASDGLPAYVELIGETPMGAAPSFTLETGQCALIHTGGMLPSGADAVVMLEVAQVVRELSYEAGKLVSSGEVEIYRAVAVGENMIAAGEDVTTGQEVIRAGRRLRPAEIGGLMALGLTYLPVSRRPSVAILSSGDEVVPPDIEPGPGQVRDVNAYTLCSLVQEAGGDPVFCGIVPDRPDALLAVSRQALAACDMLVITAGSSASIRDLTAQTINALGFPGVLVHGVNVRPGKPTILGICQGKPVIGLPGNPVSAFVIAGLFVVPAVERLLGLQQARPRPSIKARMTLNLPSQAGREDWVPVRLVEQGDETLAEPVFGKSNLIFTLARADGLVCIPPDATGLEVGAWVEVTIM